jgi:hypothetical protein
MTALKQIDATLPRAESQQIDAAFPRAESPLINSTGQRPVGMDAPNLKALTGRNHHHY